MTVSLEKHRAVARADATGHWKVSLPALPAGGPYTLTVAGATTVTVQDVLIGEVWLASGQSNMQFALRYANHADQEIARATSSTLRFFSTPRLMALDPQPEVNAHWVTCSPATADEFSAVAYFFARELQRRLGVPVGILQAAYGGSMIQPYMDRATLDSDPSLAPEIAFLERARKDPKLLTAGGSPTVPTCTYNTMIHPLVPYRLRGVLWYQGEANTGEAYRYRTLFPAFITGWRRLWNEGDFPFLFVQLAGFGPVLEGDGPGDSNWAELREAQALALSLPNTGMATAIDIGDAKDIHPTNKQDVGTRLALAAGRLVYGWKDEYSGPVYRSLRINGPTARVRFTHTTGGLVHKGDTLAGFALAGADRHFYWADAVIEKDTVVLSSPKVPNPVAVRYAWGYTPPCSLYNAAGLPAPPFRTDDWPGVTAPH